MVVILILAQKLFSFSSRYTDKKKYLYEHQFVLQVFSEKSHKLQTQNWFLVHFLSFFLLNVYIVEGFSSETGWIWHSGKSVEHNQTEMLQKAAWI